MSLAQKRPSDPDARPGWIGFRVGLLRIPLRAVRWRRCPACPDRPRSPLARLGVIGAADAFEDRHLAFPAERFHHRLAGQRPPASLSRRRSRPAPGPLRRPWSVHAIIQVDDQNALLLRLFQRRDIPFGFAQGVMRIACAPWRSHPAPARTAAPYHSPEPVIARPGKRPGSSLRPPPREIIGIEERVVTGL